MSEYLYQKSDHDRTKEQKKVWEYSNALTYDPKAGKAFLINSYRNLPDACI